MRLTPPADDEGADEDDEQDHTADHRHQQHRGVGTIADDWRGNWESKQEHKCHPESPQDAA